MKKEYVRYAALLIIIMIFGLFVYPTLYKYDKLNQKFPVRINRITGQTQILTGTAWTSTEKEATVSEVKKIKSEIEKMISDNHDKLKQEIVLDVSTDIKDDVIRELKSEISSLKEEIVAAKSEIEVYKKFETNPDNYFTIGDSKDTVKNIMGTPDDINNLDYAGKEIWRYGLASVTFQNGKVKEWSNYMNKLRVK